MQEENKEDIRLAIDQKESVKLEHNSRGYNWEIKLIIENKDDEAMLKRLKELNEKLVGEYGGSL